MDKQLKEAKASMLQGELANFEFTPEMKENVMNKIHTASKGPSFGKNKIFPALASAALVVLFFGGMYNFIIDQDANNNGANTEQTPGQEPEPTPPAAEQEKDEPKTDGEETKVEQITPESPDKVEETEAPATSDGEAQPGQSGTESEPETETNTESETEQEAGDEDKQETPAATEPYFGKWEITKVAGYGPVGMYSKDQIAAMIGETVNYAAGEARHEGTKLASPSYKEETQSKSDYERNERIKLESIGITANFVDTVTVYTDKAQHNVWNSTGNMVLIKDPATLILYDGGVYFEMKRTN